MTPHETKVQECADSINEVLPMLMEPVAKSKIVNAILRHFPEPQNEYNCPQVCAKCNRCHRGECEPVEKVCEWESLTMHHQTSCGRMHYAKEPFDFCPYCGGRIKV